VKPLTALLSQACIAFAIEFDNEFEARVPHHTTLGGEGAEAGLPWLVSLGMWALYLRHIDDDGVSVRDFVRRAGLSKEAARAALERLIRWWGYLDMLPPPGGTKSAPKGDWTLRPSSGGVSAFRVWRVLAGIVEERWRQRLGAERVGVLRAALERLACELPPAGTYYLPIGQYGLFTPAPVRRADADGAALPLYALLCAPLIAAAIEVERESSVAMALGENVLRVLARGSALVSELPAQTGLTFRAVASSLTYLLRQGLAVEERRGRFRAIALTQAGIAAELRFRERIRALERNWRARYGGDVIDRVRAAIEQILAARDGNTSALGAGLLPPPKGWRAARPYLRQTEAFVAEPESNLAHFPVIAHRGAWPDGS
jgi:DNA-binding transcriptional ArsR family regulator